MTEEKSLAEKSIEIAEKLDLWQVKFHGFLINYIKNNIPRLISVLIIGGILKYLLDVKGMDYVIIAMFLMVMVRWGADR